MEDEYFLTGMAHSFRGELFFTQYMEVTVEQIHGRYYIIITFTVQPRLGSRVHSFLDGG